MIQQHKIAYFSPAFNKHIHTLIAVTGATGFLGAHVVCRLVQNGAHVRALKRKSSSAEEFNYIFTHFFSGANEAEKTALLNRIQWVEADILDTLSLTEAFKGVTTIYHCAAMVSFLQKHRETMMKINVEGTANVVNMALQCGVETLCHVSSIAALGRAKGDSRIDETSKWSESKDNSNYALSKYKAELETWRGAEEGLKVVVVNPGVILGIGNWQKGSCRLFDMVWNGMPFYTHGVNGYVDVKDVARAMIELVEQNKYGQRFVLAPHNMMMKTFLDETASLMNRKKPSLKVTPFLAKMAAGADFIKSLFTGKEPAITKETARTSLKQYHYSSDKIMREISFVFTPMNQTLQYICTTFIQKHS